MLAVYLQKPEELYMEKPWFLMKITFENDHLTDVLSEEIFNMLHDFRLAINVKTATFCDVTLYYQVDGSQCFGGTCYICLQHWWR
jgi:hypothetical protein